MSWRQTQKSLKLQAEGVEVYSGGSEMQQHGRQEAEKALPPPHPGANVKDGCKAHGGLPAGRNPAWGPQHRSPAEGCPRAFICVCCQPVAKTWECENCWNKPPGLEPAPYLLQTHHRDLPPPPAFITSHSASLSLCSSVTGPLLFL